MRLTTRLTQLATWLLARRAVMNGEPMPRAGSANDPLLLPPITRMAGSKGYDDLPAKLKELVEAGYKLHEKVYRFDAVERGVVPAPLPRLPNAVAVQVAQIQAAFGN
jgi:regulator of CtrA degradation